MADTLTNIKDIAIVGLVIGGGIALYYLFTDVIPAANKSANAGISNTENNAVGTQEAQVSSGDYTPTIQTSVANQATNTQYQTYLDVPKNVIQGQGETVYAYSTNPQAKLFLNIENAQGLGIWSATGTGRVSSPDLDTLNLTVGQVYSVGVIDSTDSINRISTFTYESANSNSIGNFFGTVEQGGINVVSAITSGNKTASTIGDTLNTAASNGDTFIFG